MNSGSRRRGFTLIEVMVAVALISLGITVGLGAIAAMGRTEGLVLERERMQRLAVGKLDELIATGDYETVAQGDFQEQGEPGYEWSIETEPSGIENLDAVTVTVQPAGQGRADNEIRVRSLAYRPPLVMEAP